jgi:Tfp pilus assembly protein PilF
VTKGDRAIGLLLDDATGEELGTAFAVPGGHALTALHVVGDRDDYESPVRHPVLVLQLPSGPVFATVKAWDNDLDVALLTLDRLPGGVELIGLSDEIAAGDWYQATGFFELDPLTPSSSVTGRVSDAYWRLATGVYALQLSCAEASAANPTVLRGLSGGPVCAGTSSLAVGVVRRNPDPDGSGVARGGIVMASRIADVLRCWPRELAPAVQRPSAETAERRLRRLLRQVGPHGGPPLVREADAHRAGVKRTAHDNEPGGAPYVPRRIDEDLNRALATAVCVIITGKANAGKSRAAWEAVSGSMPDAVFITPRNRAAIGPLLIDDAAAVGDRPAVVWLDELREFLADGSGDGLDAVVLDEVRARRPRWRLLATWRDDDREEVTRGGELDRNVRELLEHDGVARPYLPVRPSPSELRQAELKYPAENFDRDVGIGEHLTATPELLRDYELREQEDPFSWALVRAAADWRRLGMDKPMPVPDLIEVATAEARSKGVEAALTPEELAAAEAWAFRPHPNSHVALLTLIRDEGRDHVTVLDQVVEFEDSRQAAAPGIPLEAWQAAIHNADRKDMYSLVGKALNRRDSKAQLMVALAGFQVFRQEPRAGLFVGIAAAAQFKLGNLEAAQTLAQFGVTFGPPTTGAHCLALLGSIHEGRGDLARAREYYEQAIATGHAHTVDESLEALAELALRDLGPDEWIAAYRRAAEHGSAELAWARWRQVAYQCSRHGRHAEAGAADKRAGELAPTSADQAAAYLAAGEEFLRVTDLPSTTASLELARRLDQGDSSAEAAILLGQLYANAGRAEEAAEEYRYARHTGTANPAGRAGLYLAALHERQGETGTAERTLLRVGMGEDGATAGAAWVRLAKLALVQGDAQRTRQALTRARQYTGMLPADDARELGELLEERGDGDGAVEAYRRATVGADNQEYAATVSLAKVHARLGDLGAAESVLRDLASHSSPEVRGWCLSEFAQLLGDPDQKISVYTEAVATGFSHAGWAKFAIAGVLHDEKDDVAGAAEILAAMREEPDLALRAHALCVLALIEETAGDVVTAKSDYRAAVSTGHYDTVTLAGHNLGVLLTAEHDTVGAIAAFRAAVDAIPPAAQSHPGDAMNADAPFTNSDAADAARLLAELNKDEDAAEAEALWRRALASKFDFPGGLASWHLANAARDRGDYPLSLFYYRKATERLLRASPPHAFHAAGNWALLSREHADRPVEEEALHAAAKAAQPESMWAVTCLARYALQDSDPARAQAVLENAIETLPASVTAQAWLALSGLYVLQSAPEDARAAAERATRLGDRDTALAAGCALGELALAGGDVASAEAAFRAATEAEDREVAAVGWISLGDSAANRGDSQAALDYWGKAVAVASEPGKRETMVVDSDEFPHRAHFALGYTLIGADPADERAREHLRAVLEHAPCEHTARAGLALGDAQLSTGEPETALVTLAHATTNVAGNEVRAEAHFLRGLAYGELGQLADAEAAYRKAASSGIQSLADRARVNLANTFAKGGKLAEARGLTESLLSSEDPEILAYAHGTLGEVRGMQGELEDAFHWLALAAASGIPVARIEALIAKAELLASSGDTASARAAYAELLLEEDEATVANARQALAALDDPAKPPPPPGTP